MSDKIAHIYKLTNLATVCEDQPMQGIGGLIKTTVKIEKVPAIINN